MGSVRESERGNGFFQAIRGGRQRCDQHCFAVSAKAVLEESGELGFPKRNVRQSKVIGGGFGIFGQGGDAPPERVEGQVDVGQFREVVSLHVTLFLGVPFFAACQVNQIEFGFQHPEMWLLVFCVSGMAPHTCNRSNFVLTSPPPHRPRSSSARRRFETENEIANSQCSCEFLRRAKRGAFLMKHERAKRIRIEWNNVSSVVDVAIMSVALFAGVDSSRVCSSSSSSLAWLAHLELLGSPLRA